MLKEYRMKNTSISKKLSKSLVTLFSAKLPLKDAYMIFIQFCLSKNIWCILLCVLNERTIYYLPEYETWNKRFTVGTWNLYSWLCSALVQIPLILSFNELIYFSISLKKVSSSSREFFFKPLLCSKFTYIFPSVYENVNAIWISEATHPFNFSDRFFFQLRNFIDSFISALVGKGYTGGVVGI